MSHRSSILAAMFCVMICAFSILATSIGIRDEIMTAKRIQEKIDLCMPIGAENLNITSLQIRLGENSATLRIEAEGRQFLKDFVIKAQAKVQIKIQEETEFFFYPETILVDDVKIEGKDVYEKAAALLGTSERQKANKETIGKMTESVVDEIFETALKSALRKMPIKLKKSGADFTKCPENIRFAPVTIGNDYIRIRTLSWKTTDGSIMFTILFIISLLVLVMVIMSPPATQR